jgi:hypothetical protein
MEVSLLVRVLAWLSILINIVAAEVTIPRRHAHPQITLMFLRTHALVLILMLMMTRAALSLVTVDLAMPSPSVLN